MVTATKTNDDFEIGEEGQRSKTDLVREALAKGKQNPTEGCEWIQENFNVEVLPNYFSFIKSKELHKKIAAKAARRLKMEGEQAAPVVKQPMGTAAEMIADVGTLRALTQKYGKATVQQLFELAAPAPQ